MLIRLITCELHKTNSGRKATKKNANLPKTGVFKEKQIFMPIRDLLSERKIFLLQNISSFYYIRTKSLSKH